MDSQRSKWGIVLGLSLLSVSAGAYEIVPASITPVVKLELGVGSVAAGWIVSVMYATAVIASVPVGLGLDRTTLWRAVSVATVLFGVANIWGWHSAVTGNYLALLVSRVLGGLAYVTVWNLGASTIGNIFTSEKRATATGIFTASAPLGFALGQFGGPVIETFLGWESVFYTFSVVWIIGIAVFWTGKRRIEVEKNVSAAGFDALGRVLREKSVWYISGIGFTAFSLYLVLNTWMPSYLSEEIGLSLTQSGLIVAVFPAIGIVSRTTGGILSDRFLEGKRRPLGLVSFGVATPVVGFLGLMDVVYVVIVLLLLAGFYIQLEIGLMYTHIREVIDSEVAATAISVLTSLGLLGAFTAPIIAGALIESVGYRGAFGYAVGAGIMGLVFSFLSPEPGIDDD